MDRLEFRANLKAKKYAGKERVKSTAFDSDEGNDGEEGKSWTGGLHAFNSTFYFGAYLHLHSIVLYTCIQ